MTYTKLENIPPDEETQQATKSSKQQITLFIIVGGFSAAINFLSRIILNHWLSYALAIIIAYCIGMITAFLLNRTFVFKYANNSLREQAFWFTVVNLAAVAQTLLVSLALANYVLPALGLNWHAELVAHAFGVAVPVITSYIGHKHLSFKGD
jgi:putative flippase GtrA